jgi:hypothetical protein
MSKPKTITVRLTDEQHARLHAASAVGPYRVSLTEIIARGIELASQELEQMNAARSGASS